MVSVAAIVVACGLVGQLCLAQDSAPKAVYEATSEIFLAEDWGSKSLGVLTLKQYNNSGVANVVITGNLTSILPAGLHGFHIHATAPNKDTGCSKIGAHYNPFDKAHGAPSSDTRHVGDLGNVVADDQGNVQINITDSVIQVGFVNRYNIVGKTIAVHKGVDDLGVSGLAGSNQTGNAGAIMACGTIVENGSPSLAQLGRVVVALLGLVLALVL